jgi:hypothetical protein
VPQGCAFTLTVAPGTVNLTVSGATATGTLEDVTVTDTRNYYPGWSVSGQTSSFDGSGAAAGSTFSGNQLGRVPTAVGSLEDGASLGGTAAPVSPRPRHQGGDARLRGGELRVRHERDECQPDAGPTVTGDGGPLQQRHDDHRRRDRPGERILRPGRDRRLTAGRVSRAGCRRRR